MKFENSGMVDIGDRLLKIGDGNVFPEEPKLAITFDSLREFFESEPYVKCVTLELSRPDQMDSCGLPLMPVTSIVGPFEKIRRVIEVVQGDSNVLRERDNECMKLYAETNNPVDLGISCLKVTISFDRLSCGQCFFSSYG